MVINGVSMGGDSEKAAIGVWVESLVICIRVKKGASGGIDLEGIMWELSCESFPFSLPSLHLYARILGPADAELELLMKIEGPDGYIQEGETRHLRLGSDGGVNLMSPYKGLPFPRPGAYRATLYLDGVKSGEATLTVKQMQLAPGSPSTP